MHTDTDKALAAWRQAVATATAAMQASNNVPPDPDLERADRQASERVRQLAREAWAMPVSGPGDLRLRAEIVRHALWAYDDGLHRFEAVLAGVDAADNLELSVLHERAVAELVRAILWAPAAPTRDVLVLPGSASPAAGIEPEALDGDVDYALPVGLEGLVTRAKKGVTAAMTLWAERMSDPLRFPDLDLAASIWFCLDALETLVERMEAEIAASIRAGDAAADAKLSSG